MNIALIKSYTDKPWRSPETYQMIEGSLREKWPVESIATEDADVLHSFLSRLKKEYGDHIFVFNIAEYLDETHKTGFLPELLEEWNIPHLGSGAEAIADGLDKARTKTLLDEQHIPTPRYFVASRADSDYQYAAESIGYPLIVKPLREGGHIGIDEDSIVYDDTSLHAAIRRVLEAYQQPALVEAYIIDPSMREFSVGILEGETRLYTPVEIDYESMDVEIAILSHEAAENDLERIKLVPGEQTREAIIDLSERTFEAVGACDYSRVDIRMDQTGFYVLEINTMPGLGPHSFLPEAAKEIYALEYSQLIQNLAEVSIKRQNISLS
jgi:D-alanine-D-alanine ligase